MLGLTRAPELDRAGLHWFNVDGPLALDDLRGRLVILDFWTFCCINCLHVVPTLRRIEEAYPDDVLVIGIHSPKFTAEHASDHLAHAIAWCDIRHPVIHDPSMVLWSEYGVHAWPTLVFVGPDGRIVGHLAGEPDAERLLAGVGTMIRDWRAKGMLAPRALPLRRHTDPGGRLRFPGKLKPLVNGDGVKRWALADGGHNQIVVFDDAGAEIRRFGSGRRGFVDSDAAGTAFNGPQGLICGDGAIFVADTGNHAIRRIDLTSGETITLAGGGNRGKALGYPPTTADATDLASVWDLELAGHRLFFANAGTHQLGELDLRWMTVRPVAGSSTEDIVDGPAMEAHLAQPSGLALDGDKRTLFFTDAESSSIRALTLEGPSRVETLVGTGLHDFGHENGSFGAASFQHPMGLAWWDGRVVVADSFNGCLRVLDLERREVHDLDEGGFESTDHAALPAGELAGVVADGRDRLLMTDTNNHRVVEVRPRKRTIRTWIG